MAHSSRFQDITNEAQMRSKRCSMDMFCIKQKFDMEIYCEFWCQPTDYNLPES